MHWKPGDLCGCVIMCSKAVSKKLHWEQVGGVI